MPFRFSCSITNYFVARTNLREAQEFANAKLRLKTFFDNHFIDRKEFILSEAKKLPISCGISESPLQLISFVTVYIWNIFKEYGLVPKYCTRDPYTCS